MQLLIHDIKHRLAELGIPFSQTRHGIIAKSKNRLKEAMVLKVRFAGSKKNKLTSVELRDGKYVFRFKDDPLETCIAYFKLHRTV